MKFNRDLPLDGLILIELDVFRDSRGFFTERYNATQFFTHGFRIAFHQDNHARSYPGTIRGLHYQIRPNQGKLVSCVGGAIYDVAVDLRVKSTTYGKHYAVELREDRLLWIPAGFAHGYCTLGTPGTMIDVIYKVDHPRSTAGEGGIRWDDPELKIDWPIGPDKAIVSARDRLLPDFAEYRQNPAFT